MNKRTRLKQEKVSNLARQNNILDTISKELVITEKEFGNGYFIYDIGKKRSMSFLTKRNS